MPEQLTEEELVDIIKQVISEVGATSKADMGKVMTAVMPKVKGKTDGSLVNKLVIQLLDKNVSFLMRRFYAFSVWT